MFPIFSCIYSHKTPTQESKNSTTKWLLIRHTVLTLLEDYHLFKKDNAQLQVSILIKNTTIKVHRDNFLNTSFFKKIFPSYCPFHFKVTFLFQSLVTLPTCLEFQNCHSMFPNLLLYMFQQEITILQKAP